MSNVPLSVNRRIAWIVSRWTTCLTSCWRVEVKSCCKHGEKDVTPVASTINDISLVFSLSSFRNPRLQSQPRPFPCPSPLWPTLPNVSSISPPPLPSYPYRAPHLPAALCGRALLRQRTPGRFPGEHHRGPSAGRGARWRPDSDRRPPQPNAEHAQHPGPSSLPHGHIRPGLLPPFYRFGLWRPHFGQHGLAGCLHGGERQWRERRRSGERRRRRRRNLRRGRRDKSGTTGAAHSTECLLGRFSGQHRPAAALGVMSVALRTDGPALAHTVYRLRLYSCTYRNLLLSLPLQGSLAHTNIHKHLTQFALSLTGCYCMQDERHIEIEIIEWKWTWWDWSGLFEM